MVLVNGSQTELGDGKVKYAIGIRSEAMPGNEQIEHRHRETQTSLKLIPSSMKNLFEVVDGRQKRQGSLNNHAFIVRVRLAYSQIRMIALHRMKTEIRVDHHFFGIMLNHRLEVGIRPILRKDALMTPRSFILEIITPDLLIISPLSELILKSSLDLSKRNIEDLSQRL